MADTTEIDILSGSGEEDENEISQLINKTLDGEDITNNIEEEDINDDYINNLLPNRRRTGIRANKDYDIIKQKLDEFSIPKLSRDINTYRRYFLDIIINGNFRVKYIPSCAFHLVLLVNQLKITVERDLMKMEHLHIVYYLLTQPTLIM